VVAYVCANIYDVIGIWMRMYLRHMLSQEMDAYVCAYVCANIFDVNTCACPYANTNDVRNIFAHTYAHTYASISCEKHMM